MNKAQALEYLHEQVKPGDTLYTILRHVSASGMTRDISVVVTTEDGPHDITYLVAAALGYKVNQDHGGVRVGGCGMDMGFAVVYDLSSVMFPDGFGCIGKREYGDYPGPRQWCHSNDHSNGDRDYTPHSTERMLPSPEANHWHRDGGYALSQRWL